MADSKISQYTELTTPGDNDLLEIVDMSGTPTSKKVKKVNLLKGHKGQHQNGGTDQINVSGLSGQLADPQAPVAHAASHKSGGGDVIKLDELGTPTDNTGLNVSSGAHGLTPKLPNDSGKYLNGQGGWSVPAGTGGGDVLGPSVNMDKYIPLWDGTNSKTLQNGIPPSNRNWIINPCGVIFQRPAGAYPLVKDVYGVGADRHYGMATGTSVNAGSLTNTQSANCGKSGYAFKYSGVTITGTGIIYHRYRMEAKEAVFFKNQTASLSLRVYHDIGSAVNYTIYVRKANNADTFSAVTEISHNGPYVVNSATETLLKYENFAMGDCANGIEIEIKIECGAVTAKNLELTEFKLEISPLATNFQGINYAEELILCQRYGEKVGGQSASVGYIYGYGEASSYLLGNIYWKTTKRSTPTIALNGVWGVVNSGQPTANNPGVQGCVVYSSIIATGTAYFYPADANCYIWAECEL